MIKQTSNRTWGDHYKNFILFISLFLYTLIGLKKECNNQTNYELKYIIDNNTPFKRKPKDNDEADNGREEMKSNIKKGLGGEAECKS
ncbi:unnamed protein product [Paramecium octaurelia]|uniref:Uncharacterized protein n=1 Tax=Paramecium octaurelia TaxID=43137 RepID=A0A8S1YFC6_PAROT|nr:unnamed protein product [Paramecium octaurelia]